MDAIYSTIRYDVINAVDEILDGCSDADEFDLQTGLRRQVLTLKLRPIIDATLSRYDS